MQRSLKAAAKQSCQGLSIRSKKSSSRVAELLTLPCCPGVAAGGVVDSLLEVAEVVASAFTRCCRQSLSLRSQLSGHAAFGPHGSKPGHGQLWTIGCYSAGSFEPGEHAIGWRWLPLLRAVTNDSASLDIVRTGLETAERAKKGETITASGPPAQAPPGGQARGGQGRRGGGGRRGAGGGAGFGGGGGGFNIESLKAWQAIYEGKAPLFVNAASPCGDHASACGSRTLQGRKGGPWLHRVAHFMKPSTY